MDCLPDAYRFLLEPVDPDAPCGADLEYDPQYLELFIRIVPKEKKVIGGSLGSERLESEFEPVRWSEVERDCLNVLRRTRDLRLIAVWLRCRTQLGRAAGLRQGLHVLERLLSLWPQDLYPRLESEGEPDPLPRADALLALVENQGLLADIRNLTVGGSGGLRLEMRAVERSFSRPLAEDALPPEAMRHRLAEVAAYPSSDYTDLVEALRLARAIDALVHAQLGLDAPDLGRLLDLLALLESPADRAAAQSLLSADADSSPEGGNPSGEGLSASSGGDVPEDAASGAAVSGGAGTAGTVSTAGASDTVGAPGVPGASGLLGAAPFPPSPAFIANRHVARERIREVRLWFEEHEPSSPVPLLLRQAEQLIGRRFADVVNCLPPDLLQQWDAE